MTNADHGRDPYDRLIELFTDALQEAGTEGVTRQDVLPALIDFTTSIALITAGEAAVRAAVIRMESRIEDWRAGKFPAPSR